MRRKTTVYLQDEVLRAAKVYAARSGLKEYQVVEDALRLYLGMELLDQVGRRSKLGEREALNLAYRELRASRAAR